MEVRAGERVCVGGWGALWGYVRAGVLLLVALLFGGRIEVADNRVVRCVRAWCARTGVYQISELVLDAEVEELRVVLLNEAVVLGVESDILVLVIKSGFEDGAVALIEVCVVADVVPTGA